MTALQRIDENSNAADIATDFKRVIRWVTVLIQLVLLSIMLAGAATLTGDCSVCMYVCMYVCIYIYIYKMMLTC